MKHQKVKHWAWYHEKGKKPLARRLEHFLYQKRVAKVIQNLPSWLNMT